MQNNTGKALEPYKKDLTISAAMGAQGREREYMEHFRKQGIRLKKKYTRQ